MSLTPTQQAISYIKKSSNVLLCLSHHAKIDNIVAAMAMQKFLHALNKKATIVCQDLFWPKKLSFLSRPTVETILEKKTFIITLDTSKAKAKELSYQANENSLDIFIEAQEGHFHKNDITIKEDISSHDIIITLGVTDLNYLGELFSIHSKFFYDTPLINIDSSSDNEGYGSIQLVDITSTSTSEIVFYLLYAYNKNQIDNQITTELLTGIIAQTNCFRMINIPPKTLRAAAELIKLGADREKIISHLYRTRTLPILKLWGRVLVRLKYDQLNHIAWSRVYLEDFLQTKTTTEHLLDVVDEIIINLSNVNMVIIFFEGEKKETRGFISLIHPHITPSQLIKSVKLSGNRRFAYFHSKHDNIPEIEQKIINEIRKNYKAIRSET